MIAPEAFRAGFADAFLRGYLAHATDEARAYCEVDVRVVRSILGVPESTIHPNEPLVESCGCCLVAGIGTAAGGLAILYWSPEIGYHQLVVACHPYKMPVSAPTEEDPEY